MLQTQVSIGLSKCILDLKTKKKGIACLGVYRNVLFNQ